MKKIILITAFVFLLPFSARSETRRNSFEFSPFAGYNIFQKRQNLKNGFMYGGRLDYNIWEHIGLEASAAFISSKVDDTTLRTSNKGQFISPKNNVNLALYSLDVIYNIQGNSKISTFLVAGYGAAQYSPKISDRAMSGFEVGIGAKFWASDFIGFRIDLRDFMVGEVLKHSYQNFNASVGIIFALGGNSTDRTSSVKKHRKKVVIRAAEPKAGETVDTLAEEPDEKDVVLAFEDVHFEFGKSELSENAKILLKRTIQTLKNNPKTKLRIAGYTSAAGTDEYNQVLSERRAMAVKSYLTTEGFIEANRLSTIGYGDTRPAEFESSPNDEYSQAAKANMRVLFEIILN